MIAVGLMSGTSLDGIDAALIEIRPHGARYTIELLDFVTQPFAPELADALRAALPPNAGSVAQLAKLHHDLGLALAQAAGGVARERRVDFVASHGQSIWHQGERRITMQIGDAFPIRAALHATVCYDFRTADTAAGGCGAPLVPYFDAVMLAADDEDRVALNLGGIANFTVLPRGVVRGPDGAFDVVAYDSGPGNMLIDSFVRLRTGGTATFDRDGALAARGRIDAAVLSSMLSDPYFAAPAPKSTGRERFGAQFLAGHGLDGLSLEDGAATLTALTAASVADAIGKVGLDRPRVLVSGGGAQNPQLMTMLAQRLAGGSVESLAVMGIDPDAKEAIAFALLGYETLRARVSNVPRATGAARAVCLGAIAPYDLTRLLVRVEAECAP
jgi:anhydro-N-acetylmuramic acid kinase